jgi:hypothetical protein
MDLGKGLLADFELENWRCKPCAIVMVRNDPDELWFDRHNSPGQNVLAAIRGRANELAVAKQMKSRVDDIVNTPIDDVRWTRLS